MGSIPTRGQKIFSLPRVVPCFPLLGLTPSGLFMGLSSTIIYTSELILCSTICVPSATRHNIHMYSTTSLAVKQSSKTLRKITSSGTFVLSLLTSSTVLIIVSKCVALEKQISVNRSDHRQTTLCVCGLRESMRIMNKVLKIAHLNHISV